MKSDLWDNFHDGTIVSIHELNSNCYEIKVDIEYLLEGFLKKAEFILVHIEGNLSVKFLQWASSEAEKEITDLNEIMKLEFDIVSAEDNENTVEIFCSNGVLFLAYEKEKIYLSSGETISLEQLNIAHQRSYSGAKEFH